MYLKRSIRITLLICIIDFCIFTYIIMFAYNSNSLHLLLVLPLPTSSVCTCLKSKSLHPVFLVLVFVRIYVGFTTGTCNYLNFVWRGFRPQMYLGCYLDQYIFAFIVKGVHTLRALLLVGILPSFFCIFSLHGKFEHFSLIGFIVIPFFVFEQMFPLNCALVTKSLLTPTNSMAGKTRT